MKQLTVRNLGPELERRLHEIAMRRDTSLNKAAVYLMRRGAGLASADGEQRTVGDSLREFRGTWSEEDERAVLDAVADLDRMDDEFWR